MVLDAKNTLICFLRLLVAKPCFLHICYGIAHLLMNERVTRHICTSHDATKNTEGSLQEGTQVKQLNKTLIATAVGLAVSGSLSAATLEQYKMGSPELADLIPAELLNQQYSVQDEGEVAKPSSYYVVFKQASISEMALDGANQASLQSQAASIEQTQQTIEAELYALDRNVQVLQRTQNLAAGLVVQASDEALATIAQNPDVAQVLPVYDSKPTLVQSVEYMKAKAGIVAGTASGKGQRVAILDTGVDYTHKAIGGAGTVAAYTAQDQKVAPTWPQGKVLGGYDFINNDGNPIDPTTAGHGTQVASSVLATAPEAELYAYTVCNSGCPGAAQIGALEAAMDPNKDGDIADRVNVINMSLGGQFGRTATLSGTQFLIQRAVKLGVNMVISAGNDGPNPFRVGGPSTTPNALSVGAMTHPAGKTGVFEKNTIGGKAITMSASSFNPSSVFEFTDATAPLTYVTTNALGCDPYAADSLKDKAVLIDRGTCNFTAKVLNAQNAGAKFVIIVNNAAGAGPAAPGGSDPAVKIPSVGISLEDGAEIKKAIAAGNVAYAIKSAEIATAGGIATFTSRGPAMDGLLKPEITAPGTNILMAEKGSGDKYSLNSGTSFSGPLTAGAVASLRHALPTRNAFEIKATIMNAANPDVYDLPKAHPQAKLAPISAIGAGLVDVEKAAALPVAAWVEDATFDTKQAALSFGLVGMTKATTLTKKVTLKNFTATERTYNLRIKDRFADDTATGALKWNIPASVKVPANQTITFDVSVTIDPTKVPAFGLQNTTPTTSKDAALTKVEYDGALVFDDPAVQGDYDLHLVYHVIPQARAEFAVSNRVNSKGKSEIIVKNNGAVEAQPFTTQLVATSPKKAVAQDIRAVSLDVLQVPTTTCSSGYLLLPSLTLENGLTHLLQANVGFDLDIDNNGTYDFTAMSLLFSRLNSTNPPGLMVTFTVPYGTLSGFSSNLFHATGQRNVTLSSCFERIGLTGAQIGNTIGVRAFAINDGWALGYNPATNNADDVVVATAKLQPAPDAVFKSGEAEVTKLAPGAEAVLNLPADKVGKGLVVMSDSGDAIFTADLSQAAGRPVITADRTFAVNENTAAGTTIGQLAVDVDYAAQVTEFITTGASSTKVKVEKDGRIVVASDLDFESNVNTITLDVVAVNSKGMDSDVARVTVNVNNVADAKPTVSLMGSGATLTEGDGAGITVATANVKILESGATTKSVTVSPSLFTYKDGAIVTTRAVTGSDVGSQSITVTVTDSANLSATASTTLTVTAAPKSSGGAGGLLALMLLPLALLRRKIKA